MKEKQYTLGDFVEVPLSSMIDPQSSSYDRFVGLEHYDSHEPVITRYSGKEILTSSVKEFKRGDILIARRNVYLERSGVAIFDGITSGDSIILRVKEDIDHNTGIPAELVKRILPFVLNSNSFWAYANRHADGMNSKRISKDKILDFEFNLPSIEYLSLLSDKLWAAYELKRSYQDIIKATDEMVKSQFIEMFWGGKYTMKKLRGHIEVLRGVSYKPSDVHEDLSDNTSIVLRSNNIDGGQVNFDDLVYVDSERVSEHQVLNAGDIVMCGSNGSKKLVGKAALLDETPRENTSFGAFCLGIRCKSSIIPEYLATYFQTSLYRDKIEALGSGSNILNIKPDHIYDLEIPIPSLGEQETFVSIVKQADKSKFELKKAIEAIDKVIKSLINENL